MKTTMESMGKQDLQLQDMTVLCAEDEAQARHFLANYLRRKGAKILEAENGEEGLRLFQEHRPDIVISDIRMPVMDGVAMSRAIREVCADTPIIFLSAHSDTELLQEAIGLETVKYIIKPVTADSLRSAIQTAQKKLEKQQSLSETLTQLHTTIVQHQNESERLQGFVSQIIGHDSHMAVKALSYPKDLISGDFYKIEANDHGLYVMLADGMGHGLSAILPALDIPKKFQDLAAQGFSLSRIADELNQTLFEHRLPEHFLVVTLVKLDVEQQLVDVINCGNPPALLMDMNGRLVHKFPSNHLAWGIVGGDDFVPEVQTFQYEFPCKLYLFSDGLSETLETQCKKCGVEGVIELIRNASREKVLDEIDAHFRQIPENQRHDDITLLEISYLAGQKQKPSPFELELDAVSDEGTLDVDLSSLKWLSVLYVEDDADALAYLSKFLLRHVGALYTADNAEKGLQLYKKYKPKLVISDLSLPEMDGLQMIDRIRAIDPNVPVILISGMNPGAEYMTKVESMLELEINKFLAKPLLGDKLINTMLQCVKQFEYMNNLKVSASVFMATPLAMSITDRNRNIIAVNPAFTHITGYTSAEVEGCNPRILSSGKHDAEFYRQMWQTLNENDRWSGEIWNRRKSGELFLEWITINAIRDERGAISHYTSVFSDITQRAAAEEKLRYLAHHDPLTDLPNRVLMQDRLNLALLQAQREQTQLAVVYLDIDHFKHVNDTLGHGIGDELIRRVAQSLKSAIRESDTVSRLGGDEFAILLPNIGSRNNATRLVDKIFNTVDKCFKLAGRQLHVSFSMGISLFPDDGDNVEQLVKHADSAMYLAKKKGRNNYQFFNQAIAKQTERYMTIQHGLHQALNEGQFSIHYQPKYALDRNKVVGAEALLRWQSPMLGAVSPAEFIAIAEESGIIIEIGRWLIEKVCEDMSEWKASGAELLPVSINISPIQFLRDNVSRTLQQAIIDHRIDASLIQVELTEGVVMNGQQSTLKKLQALKALGVSISIDDFGTGYSSLSYLRQLPIDELKLDRSFIIEITDEASLNDRRLTAIPIAVIDLAMNLDLKLVAEGVETDIQCRFLLENGCEVIQGYWFSKPLTADAMKALLEQ